MKTNCENCLNCVFKGYENAVGYFDGGLFEVHKCIKGLNIENHKRRTDCSKYVSKDDITFHYVCHKLYNHLGIIITISILILLLSQMPWIASVFTILLLSFGFWIKSK